MTDTAPQALRWENGVPVSARFDDPYYSRADGLAETRYVFLEGCGLPDAWQGRPAFQVAELGFGTGLNFCALLHLWRGEAADAARLNFTSFEKYPLARDDMAKALAVWPGIAAEVEALLDVYDPRGGVFDVGGVALELVIGDARAQLPEWRGEADAWFLDGFAPARNPALWEEALLSELALKTRTGGTLATYSAAGAVRRALQGCGLDVERRAGFGGKREMLVARKP